MGYTHAIRGREPIDAEELKRTGETSFKTSTGETITLKWEKLLLPGGQPEYTDEERTDIHAYMKAKSEFDDFMKLVMKLTLAKEMTPEKHEELAERGPLLNSEMKRLKIKAEAAHQRAYDVVHDNREEIDHLEMYDSEIGHVTGYEDLADYERMEPEKEDIAVLDPSIIRSIHASFDPDEDGNKIMSSLGESDNRLARAKAMGFDTSTVWYHGTAEPDINSFKGYRGVAGHFTTDPGWAASFADSAWGNLKDNMHDEDFEAEGVAEALYPVFLRLKNIFDLRNPQHRVMIGLPESGEGVFFDYSTLEDSIKEIKAAGFDAYIDYEQPSDTDGSLAVFDPANIRSIHAAFMNSNSSNIMEVRGPHEGNELELMMAGKKPLAMIELEREPPEKQEVWDMLIRRGSVIHKQGQTITTPQPPEGRHQTDFIALPDEAWRIDRVQALYDKIEKTDSMTDNDHIDLGNLLGYSEADIRHFITGFDDEGHDGFRDEDRAMARRMGYKVNESRPAPRVAYHATFPDNRDNIRMHGLDPKYSDTFEEGAVFFATGGKPDPKMDIWKANLSGLDIEYDPTQEGGDNEHWWYTHQLVVPDRLKLVQKGTG
jgi:hypothetical protein